MHFPLRPAALLLPIAAASLAMALTAPTLAREATRSVSHRDLDLSRPEDRARLDRRIGRALEAVCGSYATVEPDRMAEIDRCRSEAEMRTRAQVARLVSTRTGHPDPAR